MRKLAVILIASILVFPKVVFAAATHVVISEIQTGTSTSASQEFVELYNPTDSDVDLTGWTLEYKSATSANQDSSWSKRATLAVKIAAHGFYLIAPKTYLPNADSDLSSGLSGTAGHVRLRDGGHNTIDLVGWGEAANAAETAPAPAPPAGQSLERLPGRLDEAGGNATDTDDNSQDFVVRSVPQPQNTSSALETPSADPGQTDPTAPDDPSPAAPAYQPITISELLVNPISPLTDAHDEFIELFNPNAQDLSLQGYTLKTGSGFHDYYVLPDLVIPAGGYLPIYSSDSHLSLTNTGGAAQLLDPTGTVVYQTPDYPAAPEGQSWAQFNDGWQWTLQLTPGRPNILVQPVLDDASPVAKTSSKAPAVAKKAAATASTKKVAKAPAVKTLATKTSTQTGTAPAATGSAIWLLIGAGCLTIGYAIYEFRYDIQNFYLLARRKFGFGQTPRPKT